MNEMTHWLEMSKVGERRDESEEQVAERCEMTFGEKHCLSTCVQRWKSYLATKMDYHAMKKMDEMNWAARGLIQRRKRDEKVLLPFSDPMAMESELSLLNWVALEARDVGVVLDQSEGEVKRSG